jgi:siroheme decarboxylase
MKKIYSRVNYPGTGAEMSFDKYDKLLIPLLCQNISDSMYPFGDLAEKVGLSEDEVITRIKEYKTSGKMRRFGAILNHQKAGFSNNAMSVWNIPTDKVDEIGEKLAEYSEISHCYIRPKFDDWKFNIYAMIHSTSEGGPKDIVEAIAKDLGITDSDYDLLFSIREFKKSSMVYLYDQK